MSLAITVEQREYAQVASHFFSRQAQIHDGLSTAQPATWTALTAELGVHGLAVPEDVGGLGGSYRDLAVVLEAGGALLQPAPLLSASTGYLALAAAGNPAVPVLKQLVSDARVAVLVDGSNLVTYGGRLTGQVSLLDGLVADDVLFHVGDQLVRVVSDAAGVEVVASTDSIDSSRGVGRWQLTAVEPAECIPWGRQGAARAHAIAAALATAEIAGGVRACLDATVNYVSNRRQFGRPVGSFQAVQHRCVDMLLDVDNVAHAAALALASADADSTDLLWAGPAALAGALECYARVARAMIQLHGATGFSYEHCAHRHLRRASAMTAFAGTRSTLLEDSYAAIRA